MNSWSNVTLDPIIICAEEEIVITNASYLGIYLLIRKYKGYITIIHKEKNV